MIFRNIVLFICILFAQNTNLLGQSAPTVVIDKGDEVMYTLDHMARIPYLEMSIVDTNRERLNTFGYALDSVPVFDSAHYATILDSMDQLTPFDLVYNDRTAAFIRLYVNKRRKQSAKLLGLQHYYFPMMEAMLAKYEMPLELKYLAVIESGLNPKARSHAGAVGLWQFMYA
ncbi:MAG: membrane-bound lytic murein transglycosylase D, partial [Dokdonia sp.]